jgi:hypothetical protein
VRLQQDEFHPGLPGNVQQLTGFVLLFDDRARGSELDFNHFPGDPAPRF